jgi:hypothetical protein
LWPLAGFDGAPLASSWWYFYDESFYWATKSGCALQLKEPDTALEAVSTSLAIFDPANLHNYLFTLLFRGEALIQKGDVAEASGVIGDVAQLAAVNSTRRIDQRVTELRTTLGPWGRTRAVRELDERLRSYRRFSRGSGNT